MRMLWRKLYRDLWRMRGQVIAIALVIAGGVATWIISLSTLTALNSTMQAFYSEQRFADAFAQAVRAPVSLLPRIAEIPGVHSFEARLRASGTVSLKNYHKPVSALIMSLPDYREPAVNLLYLRKGRLPEPGRDREVAVSEAFAEAHALELGDTLGLLVRGRRIDATLTGIVLSPEFIYQIKPGDLFPDYERYGIFWMRTAPLAALADLEGSFNDLAIRYSASAFPAAMREQADRLLAPYGGTGMYERDDQFSHRYLASELDQLEAMAFIVPVIFIGVAAFLLNIVIARLVAQQREQIATLKAFGYGNGSIAVHFLTMVLVVVFIGGLSGTFAGARLGYGLSQVYAEFFRFPYIDYRLTPAVLISGIGITMVSAVLGTWHSLQAAWSLAPAEAMRPEAPARYRHSLVERLAPFHWLPQTGRMILRHLERRPVKSLLSMLGIALSIAILTVGNFQEDAIDYMIEAQYRLAAREDLAVAFDQNLGEQAILEFGRMDGVNRVEAFRSAPVRLHYGHRSIRTGLLGLQHDAVIHRLLDTELNPVPPPEQGLLISDYYAHELGVKPGDILTLEVMDGSQPVRNIVLSRTVREFVGASAYMEINTLHRLLGQREYSGVFLDIDPEYKDALMKQLDETPAVASVSEREASISSFYETLGEMVLIFAFVNTLLAGSIAFGVIYNSARIALSERRRELASLRVLGFTRNEVAVILIGEMLILAILALPLGFLIGYGFCWSIATSMTSELYRVPLVVETSSYAFSAAVAMAALVISLIIIKYRTNRLDMIAVLKTRE